MNSVSLSVIPRGSLKLPRVTLVLSLFTGLLYFLFDPAPAMFVFNREAIIYGEWWRLISGHWVHSDAEHLLWNLGGLLVLGILLELHAQRHIVPLILASSLGIDVWLWIFSSEITLYCGLSGTLNALMGALFYLFWLQTKNMLILILGACAVIKIVIEIMTSQALFTHTVWQSLPEVHAIGCVTGLIYAGLAIHPGTTGDRRY